MTPLFEKYRDLIPDYDSFLESLERPLPNHFRVNRLKAGPVWLVERLKKSGIILKDRGNGKSVLYEAPGTLALGRLPEYFLGYIHPQALTSCLASAFLAPIPDSYVLDLCAAPGGKTAHLAEMMGNSGIIVANELNRRRHAPLGHTLSRLGVLNTVLTGYPAQEFPLRERFDFILADVPCTGEGRWRSTGYAYPEETGRFGRKMVETQKRILLRAFDLLEKHGVLLYSTCTYDPDENEGVVDFLLENRQAEMLPLGHVPGIEPGVLKWGKKKYDERLRRAGRFYPHRIDSVGFFMAKIGRRG